MTDNLRSRLIGLVGHAGSGKDTVADLLVKNYGYTKLAFADSLRDMLIAINPLIPTPRYKSQFIHLADALKNSSWNELKDDPNSGPEVRHLMQTTGTDAIRHFIGDHTWIDIMEQKIDTLQTDKIVISDVRFPNEADFINDNWGHLVRIDGDPRRQRTTGASAEHASETDMEKINDYDFIIKNKSSLNDLSNTIDAMIYIIEEKSEEKAKEKETAEETS